MEKLVAFTSFLLLLQYYVISSSAMNQFNISTDQLSLLSLKSQIISDPFHCLDESWSPGTSICHWVGVTCGSRHLRRRFLNPSNMDLTGVIPSELGNLTFLVSLDLVSNNFHGNLPQEMAHLHRLKFLDLSFNSFSAEVPSWIEFIAFTGNSLSGCLPNGLCNGPPILRGLYLSKNKLHGHMPISLSNCSQLQLSGLLENEFDGPIHSEIGRLSNLQNNLSGFLLWEIGNLTKMQHLQISGNMLIGETPKEISKLVELEELSLRNNRFSGSLDMEIFNISGLSVFSEVELPLQLKCSICNYMQHSRALIRNVKFCAAFAIGIS
ncbi:receptor kinase-like protein Xa21 [Capsicum annuum]|uniref:receptor kinase-like protein Xa21 n=1 Tax=Capsicum annuum TaxID=4072 RepID=UPI001FB0E3B5|nr:receptor kinase-like protein Xa21 [Capsicum annuum]